MKKYTLTLLILILSSMFSISYADSNKPPPSPYTPAYPTWKQKSMQKQQNQSALKKPIISQKKPTVTKTQ